MQATPVVLSNSSEETDKKLAAWLKRIMPALEKELTEGLTPVYANSSHVADKTLKVEAYQDIELKQHFTKSPEEAEFLKGAATWLSVSTQDAPVLALSCSLNRSDQNVSFVFVYQPRRSKTDAQIYWQQVASIPVGASIEILTTNPINRDMFAGASLSGGELHIWQYNSMSSAGDDSQVTELFSASSEDSIAALAFMTENRLLCCQSDGKIIVYKVISKQSTIVEKIMKIEPRNVKDPLITNVVTLPDAPDDFVAGLLNGSLLYCSTSQLMHQEGVFNPVIRELQPHKFAITSLKHCQQNRKSFVVSVDLSGEICFHQLEDPEKQPKLVMKLPLPLKNLIALRRNMEHICCPLKNGSLEVFKTSDKAKESKIEGKLSGTATVVELSRNE